MVHVTISLPLAPMQVVAAITYPHFWSDHGGIKSNGDELGRERPPWKLTGAPSITGSQKDDMDLAHLSRGEVNGNPLQYSCLENPMGGA